MGKYIITSIVLPEHLVDEEVRNAVRRYNFEAIYSNFGLMFCQAALVQDGHLVKLETLLVEKRIPFDRFTSAHTNIPPLVRQYRPYATQT